MVVKSPLWSECLGEHRHEPQAELGESYANEHKSVMWSRFHSNSEDVPATKSILSSNVFMPWFSPNEQLASIQREGTVLVEEMLAGERIFPDLGQFRVGLFPDRLSQLLGLVEGTR
jgi:hypothetical protein